MAKIIIKANKQRKLTSHFSRAKALHYYLDDKDKCTASFSFNFLDNDRPTMDRVREMAALCDEADPYREKQMILHFAISAELEPGEKITDEQLIEVAQDFMTRCHMEMCPMHIAIHRNTDHPHAHIVAARVDPETGKAVKMPLYGRAAQQSIAAMSKKHGWQLHARSRYEMQDNGQLTRLTPPPREIPAELTERLKEFCDTHRQEFKRWKWANLHQALAEIGVSMEYRNSEGLFYSLDSEHWHKASHVNSELVYSQISQQLNASSYRKARQSVLDRLAEVRAGQIQETPAQTMPYPVSTASSSPIPERQAPAAKTPESEPKPLSFTEKLQIIGKYDKQTITELRELSKNPRFSELTQSFITIIKPIVDKITDLLVKRDTKNSDFSKSLTSLKTAIASCKIRFLADDIKEENATNATNGNLRHFVKNRDLYLAHKRIIARMTNMQIENRDYFISRQIALRLYGTEKTKKEALGIMFAGHDPYAMQAVTEIFELKTTDLQTYQPYILKWKARETQRLAADEIALPSVKIEQKTQETPITPIPEATRHGHDHHQPNYNPLL